VKRSLFTLASIAAILFALFASIAPMAQASDVKTKLETVIGWGTQRNHETFVGLKSTNATTSASFWLDATSKMPVAGIDWRGSNFTVDTYYGNGKFNAPYNTDIAGYWNRNICGEIGITFYANVTPGDEEPYSVHALNTTGKKLYVYWQSRPKGTWETGTIDYKGKHIDLQLYVMTDGRLMSCSGLVLYPSLAP